MLFLGICNHILYLLHAPIIKVQLCMSGGLSAANAEPSTPCMPPQHEQTERFVLSSFGRWRRVR